MDSDSDPFSDRELCPSDTCIGVLNPDGFCPDCGRSQESSQRSSGEIAYEHRRLCADGACIGVIGSDGRCKECGKVDESLLRDPRLRGMDLAPKAIPSPLAPPESDFSEAQESISPELDEDDRQLCPDGSCLGLIAHDGQCKLCGQSL